MCLCVVCIYVSMCCVCLCVVCVYVFMCVYVSMCVYASMCVYVSMCVLSAFFGELVRIYARIFVCGLFVCETNTHDNTGTLKNTEQPNTTTYTKFVCLRLRVRLYRKAKTKCCMCALVCVTHLHTTHMKT
eukprot:GHVS01052962.1.p1 GENE.GHVS01052962.1~~GHVS01052962.1.p1  ORF type:complete len:130 (-),score=8.80 GHVS01052962.1:668-1057(-)